MKNIVMVLLLMLPLEHLMAQCSKKIDKEFNLTFQHPPYDVAKLEKIYASCQEKPVEMLLHLAKGDVYEDNGEMEFAYEEYKTADQAFGYIRENEKYRDLADYLIKQKKKYAPKTAGDIRGSMIATRGKKIDVRGAEMSVEYQIEDLPLTFQSNSSKIKEGVNKIQADEIFKALSDKKHKGKLIYIEGYTDTSGTYEHNKGLSKKRANALKNYLQSSGLKNKIHTQGFGESKPICSKGEVIHTKREYGCSIEEDKHSSRRVTISIGDM